MTTSGLPFDDFRNLLDGLPDPAKTPASVSRSVAEEQARGGSLGRVAEIASWLVRTTGRPALRIMRPQLALFAGTHAGPAGAGAAVVKARIESLAVGEDVLNRLCLATDLGLKIYDLALDLPAGDITVEAALDERGCAATMAFGMEAVAGGMDLLCVSALETDAGSSARAVLYALSGNVSDVPTGLQAAFRCHEGRLADPLEVLRRLGGRETAAISGAIVAARMEKVPVILDGSAALAAAAVLHAMNPAALDHCLLAQAADPDERETARRLGLQPLFDLGIRPGEGRAAALAAGLVKAMVQAVAD